MKSFAVHGVAFLGVLMLTPIWVAAQTPASCVTNAGLDVSCTSGSVGTTGDDNRPLPLPPSIKRNLYFVDVKKVGRRSDTDMQEYGYFDRQHIPPYRTTSDGRIAMGVKTRSTNVDEDVFRFFLYEPKRLKTSFLSTPTGEPSGTAGLDILSDRNAVTLPRSRFVAPNLVGESIHSAICNDPKAPPVTACGVNGKNDCHHFSVITPFFNKTNSRNRVEIWGTKVTVEVENPKTVSSRIIDIRTEPPVQGATWPQGPNVMLETTITGDGHLMVGRLAKAPLSFTGADGSTIRGDYDAVYSAYDPALPACDPTKFANVRPISHMPYDPLIRANWGVGRYQWTYPDGTVIPDGAPMIATYPWIDSKGNNILFGSSDSSKVLHGNDRVRYGNQIRCVDGSSCNLRAAEDDDDKRAVSVLGLWTQGRTVLMDNMINNVDYGLGASLSEQRIVKLFDGAGSDSWVRLGSGTENKQDTGKETIRGAAGNINFIDSIENKLNHDKNIKLSVPRDVAWLVSNGTVTDVLAFDDWVSPNFLISSEMVQSKTGVGMSENYRRVQNAATGIYKTPSYGEIVGVGEVERAAVGGVQGKGLFLRPTAGLSYLIAADQRRILQNDVWFVGLFIDPRMVNDLNYRRLLELPDKSAIDLQGLHSLSFVTPAGKRYDLRLNAALPFAAYSHLGFRIHQNGMRVEVFRDGMLIQDWVNPRPSTDRMLTIQPGTLWVGRGSTTSDPTKGFHGWIDSFKVIGQAQGMKDEEICNHALGSVVALNANIDPMSPTFRKASSIPSIFHDRIRRASGNAASLYACFDANKNQDGWVDLNALPTEVVSLRHRLLMPEGPMVFNLPRPDSSSNTFCLSCHSDDGTGRRPSSLLVDVLRLNSSVPKASDPRRQPVEPPAKVFGNLPARTWGSYPLANEVAPAEGKLIDEYINR